MSNREGQPSRAISGMSLPSNSPTKSRKKGISKGRKMWQTLANNLGVHPAKKLDDEEV